MRNTKNFLRFYEKNVDTVYSQYLEKTLSKEKSLELTKDFFMKSWDKVREGEKIHAFDIKDEDCNNREINVFKSNQYGY